MPVEVRPARESDIDALLVVERQCFDVYYYSRYQFSREDFESYLEDAVCAFLVAVDVTRPAAAAPGPPPARQAAEDHIVGYVLGPVDVRRTRRIAHIDSIAVLPEAQHEGIGTRLLQAFSAEARRRGARALMLEVAVANGVGLAFFTKHGFHEIRPLPDYYGRTLHGLLLAADI